MDRLEVRILGPIEAVTSQGAVVIPGERQRATLTLLALTPRQVVSLDRLVDALWGEQAPVNPAGSLQVVVSRLRSALGGAGALVVTRPPGYLLDLPPEAVDAARLELLVERAGRLLAEGDAASALAVCEEAVALRRGDPLGEFRYAQFASDEAARLDDLYALARERQADAALATGHDAGELLIWLEPLARSRPERERLWALVMLALYRAGRQSEALAAYHEARRRLEDELGLDPSPALRELEAAILNQDPALRAPPAEPALRTGSALPAPATSLVGREAEFEHISALLDGGARVVTLTGAGGVGKTRLALAAAQAASPRFRDGAVWVPLAAVEDAALVPAAIAIACGLPDITERRALLAALARRESLLVLDTLEHLLGTAGTLGALLAAAPGISLLVTSRFTLRLGGEHELAVEPLSQAAAAEVFAQRAHAADPAFADDGSVDELCRLLDGLPLALELAAARCKLLRPRQIAERLAAGEDLLATGTRDADPRQASLRATIAWSWGLLPEAEQRCLARLSVFPGSFGVESALAVEAGDLELLAGLLDRSLLRREPAEDEVRLALLPGVRAFAADQLEAEDGAEAQTRALLGAYVLALAERAAAAEAPAERAALAARLEREAASVRTAIGWAASDDLAVFERLAAALGPLFADRLSALTMLSGVRRLGSL